MSRVSKTVVVNAFGNCERCSARWNGKNALALAAQHHDRTGHVTVADQTQRTRYGDARKPGRAKEARLL